jgi:hypothetical protein
VTTSPPAEEATADAEGVVSSDALYELLGNRRRRYALHYLMQRDDPVPVTELVEQVAAWENDKSVAALNAQERKRVYVAFHQSHLSTMAGEGLIEHDEAAGTVALADGVADADIYLEVVPAYDIPWNLFYLGLSVACGLVVALTWLDVAPFGTLPDIVAGAVTVAAFAASALVQRHTTGRMRCGDPGAPPRVGES